MATIRETVYLGRDNTIDLLLKKDGSAQDLTDIDRMTLELMDKSMALVATVDSDQHSGAFDWTTETTGRVKMALGCVNGLTAGEYWVRLTTYDSGNDDGIVWGDFILTLKAEPA